MGQNADAERQQNWGWQTKQYNYKKGEDPIDEWRKRREDGTIGDLEDQYGDPKKNRGDSPADGLVRGRRRVRSRWKIRQRRTIRSAIALCRPGIRRRRR